jgi:hypothetical protein
MSIPPNTDPDWQEQIREKVRAIVRATGSQRKAAALLGVDREGVRRLLLGQSVPKAPDREKYLALIDAPVPQSDTGLPRHASGSGSGTIRLGGAGSGTTGSRAFQTPQERIAYAVGVLEAAERHRLSLGVELQRALEALTEQAGGAPLEEGLAVAVAAAEQAATLRPARTRTK